MRSSFQSKRTVSRYIGRGEYVNGDFIPSGGIDVFTIIASCQPATQRDLEALPEGRRNNDSYVLYTDTELFTAEVSLAKNPDIVELFGEEYEVAGVSRWRNNIEYYRVLVIKKVQ
jgi:hypothetical protein